MFVRVRSSALLGVTALPVDVEVDATSGFPRTQLVGLAGSAVQESLVRVGAAVRNLGFRLPSKRITVNLAPADLRKEGTGFDLPIAVALLAACGLVPPRPLAGLHLCGELSLSGEVRPVRGVLPMAVAALRDRARGFLTPAGNALEAAAVEGLAVLPVRHLGELVAWAEGKRELGALPGAQRQLELPGGALDLRDVAGQAAAKRALEIAAAGDHNLLLFGPPGSGKTMLARRLPGLLPPLGRDEALEATTVHSVAGLLRDRGLLTERPFRAPHHSISDAGLVGGSATPRPGEVSLAHRGVLFLDELPEFRRHVLESLRQPLEEGDVVLSRSGRTVHYPADFQLVAAMNPCPCGFLGDPRRACLCGDDQLLRYRRRVSGPIMDRIDMHVEIPAVPCEELSRAGQGEGTAEVAVRVFAARGRQAERGFQNARLRGGALRRACGLEPPAREVLTQAARRLVLSARAHDRILRVARTIADLEGAARVESRHLLEAVQYRALDRPASTEAREAG